MYNKFSPTRFTHRVSPWTLAFTGIAAAAVLCPAVRRTIRRIAVSTMAGAFTIVDQVQNLHGNVVQQWRGMVEEAQNFHNSEFEVTEEMQQDIGHMMEPAMERPVETINDVVHEEIPRPVTRRRLRESST